MLPTMSGSRMAVSGESTSCSSQRSSSNLPSSTRTSLKFDSSLLGSFGEFGHVVTIIS